MDGQPPAIEVAGLCKDYGRLRAVEGVSFRVRHGEIYALLGPNGAGKTTIVEILEGHRKRTSGSVRVLGFDPGTGGAVSASASGSCCSRWASTPS